MRRIQDVNVGPGPTFISRDTGLNTPGTIIRRQWMNDTQEEICGFIESSNIIVDTTLYSGGDGDRTQLGKTVAHYASGGADFYQEAIGSAADVYIFEAINLGITVRLAPPVIFDGMVARGDITAPNTGGPATININGFGNIAIKTLAGADPLAGVVSGRVTFVYNLATNEWILTSGGGSVVTGQIGETLIWDVDATPVGNWLRKTGAAVSRVTYANLFALYGVDYGIGDGVTTFNLPDDEGQTYRIQDNGKGVDPDAASRTDRGDGTTGDNVGTYQLDQFKAHNHTMSNSGSLDNFIFGAGSQIRNGGSNQNSGTSGGNETRGKNKYVTAWVRY